MLPYAYYLLKVTICSAVLFGYYWLMLRNKIFHGYNRFYLIAAVLLSLICPLININIWHSGSQTTHAIKLLTAVTGSNEYLDEIVLTSRRNTFTATQFIWIIYLFACGVFLIKFLTGLVNIYKLYKQHQHRLIDKVCLVNTVVKGTPFSFLNYIFWNNNIDISTTTGNQIFRHELVHVQQKHSYDKLFINGVLLLFWCNPFFWLIRKELSLIHEFMADKIAVENSDTKSFAAMILQATYPQQCFPLTNSFFYSPIKRRLIMLTKNKNPNVGYIGRILVLPLALLLFAAFTLKSKTFKSDAGTHYNDKPITVVLDAAHGGKDVGATNNQRSIYEKDLALSIVKKIKESNSNDNINIILTRDNDVYQSPREKADFSNAQHPDLFISIHVDAAINADKDKSGMSVFVARDQFGNAYKSKLFASSIIEQFANNYKIPVSPFPLQRQRGVWVLDASDCPAVVIETGYVTNKFDVAYLQSESTKETIAKNVLAAIERYAISIDQSSVKTTIKPIVVDTVPAKKTRNDDKVFTLRKLEMMIKFSRKLKMKQHFQGEKLPGENT